MGGCKARSARRFDDVQVPVENLLGKENQGFKYIMYNFNHERWAGCNGTIRLARCCLEQSIVHSHSIRAMPHKHKLAEMARLVHGAQCMQDNLTYQLATGKDIYGPELGG